MGRDAWFDISSEGWRRINAGRPLGGLLLEAVRNSLDEGASHITLRFGENEISVEDNAPRGVPDERLIYTLFLTDKAAAEARRGRRGRGLKELIAAFDRATVETVGKTIFFDEAGRRSEGGSREKGTRVTLYRSLSEEERRAASETISLCIPPRGVALQVDDKRISEPSLYLALSPAHLETVFVKGGVERRVRRATELRLYTPRPKEIPHLYEMGLPLLPTNLPWHVDVQQRVPRAEGAPGPEAAYVLDLKLWLFESLIPRHLDKRDLRGDWIQDVLAQALPSATALDAYISRTLPRNAVLSSSPPMDERARQLGANVIGASQISSGVYATLASVLERADTFVRRRQEEAPPLATRPTEREAVIGELARFLCMRLLGFRPRISFVASIPLESGAILDATYQREERLLSINILGRFQFDEPFSPQNLSILLHELAHERSSEHDAQFLASLEDLFSRAVFLMAEELPRLRERLRKKLPLDPEEAPSDDGATRIARLDLLEETEEAG